MDVHKKYSASGKLLLFGEHSAVYKHPALGIPLPLKTDLNIEHKPYSISVEENMLIYKESIELFFQFIKQKFPETDEIFNRSFTITTTVPPASGLGSSAALCSALAGYLKDSGLFSDKTVWSLANELEKYFHGTPSGIDTGLSLSETPQVFYFEGGPLPVRKSLPAPDFPILYGYLPREKQAKELITSVRERIKNNDKEAVSAIKNLGAFSAELAALLKQQKCSALEAGALADKAHIALQNLGVSTPKMDAIIKKACKLGCTGGKLSGAGGGGAFWLAVEDETAARRVMAEMEVDLWMIY